MYRYTDANGNEVWVKTVPTQLFESLFLFAIGALMFYFAWKGKKYNFAIYTIGYGVWRFIIEYFRADDRGQTNFNLLTPSQFTAVLLIIVGLVYVFVPLIRKKIKTE